MLGQQVLFTSRGTNPLKNWDVVCPRPSKLSEVSSSSGADAEVLSPGTISPAESRNNRAALTILNQRVSPKYVDQSASAAEKQGGCVEKVYDEEIRCFCFEIQGPGVSLVNPPQVKLAEKSKICPRPPTLSLGASQPHLLLLVKYVRLVQYICCVSSRLCVFRGQCCVFTDLLCVHGLCNDDVYG